MTRNLWGTMGSRAWQVSLAGVTFLFINAVCTQPSVSVRGPSNEPETGGDTASALSRPKDNSACVSCHQNLAKEEISSVHQRHRVLCVDCHGRSEDHGRDGGSAPSVTFVRSEIEPFCQDCHKASDHPDKRSFIKRWQGRTRPNGRTITATSTCTDCHGMHVVQR